MQADPINPTLKAPGTKRLKPKCVILLSKIAFNCNLRRYSKAVQRMIELDKYLMLALMVRPARSCPPRHPTRSVLVPLFLG